MSAKVLLDKLNRLHNLAPLQLLAFQPHRATTVLLRVIFPAFHLFLAILLQKPRRLRLRVLNNLVTADEIVEKIGIFLDALFVIRHFSLLEGRVIESANLFRLPALSLRLEQLILQHIFDGLHFSLVFGPFRRHFLLVREGCAEFFHELSLLLNILLQKIIAHLKNMVHVFLVIHGNSIRHSDLNFVDFFVGEIIDFLLNHFLVALGDIDEVNRAQFLVKRFFDFILSLVLDLALLEKLRDG